MQAAHIVMALNAIQEQGPQQWQIIDLLSYLARIAAALEGIEQHLNNQ
jgi:hypothetical protein